MCERPVEVQIVFRGFSWFSWVFVGLGGKSTLVPKKLFRGFRGFSCFFVVQGESHFRFFVAFRSLGCNEIEANPAL